MDKDDKDEGIGILTIIIIVIVAAMALYHFFSPRPSAPPVTTTNQKTLPTVNVPVEAPPPIGGKMEKGQ